MVPFTAHAGGQSTAVAGTEDPKGSTTTGKVNEPRVLRGSAGRRLVGATHLGTFEHSDMRNMRYRWFDVRGYVKPTFGMTYRPEGVPQDRWDYSAAATQIGIEAAAEPIRNWFFDVHILATGETLQNLSGGSSDATTDGGDDERLPFTAIDAGGLGSAVELNELSLGYQPASFIQLRVGQMRIPFTLEQKSASTELLFAARNTPSDVFMRGADLGGLVTMDWRGRIGGSVGVFNGATVTSAGDNERGALYSARIDITPFGLLPSGSSDFDRGPFRIGLGAGMAFMPGRQFDRTGFELMRTRDLRASASLKMSVRGLSLQLEGLRRQRTTDVEDRPLVASGAYGQVSYYLPLTRIVGFAPMTRIGWLREDESFDPRDSIRTEAGASFYIQGGSREPDDIRFTLQYLGERRIEEAESAHGLVGQLQLRW
jgi:hypothetical protein